MSKYRLSIAVVTLVSGFSITAARAADDAAGYLTTPQRAPVTASAGECVHTGEWTQGMRFGNCEPQPVKAEVAPAPVQAKMKMTAGSCSRMRPRRSLAPRRSPDCKPRARNVT